jgi:hypothetical protein
VIDAKWGRERDYVDWEDILLRGLKRFALRPSGHAMY